jgi:RimJ/RimL family protein N-acetyltransferase
VAEEQWKRIVTMPLFPDMTDAELEQITDAVIEFGGQPRRRTARIVEGELELREIGSVDLEWLERWRLEPGSQRLGDLLEADLFEWFNRYLGSDSRVYLFRSGGGAPAGVIGVTKRGDGDGEIDRLLIPAATDRGLAGRAVRALVSHLSGNGSQGASLERIQAGIPADQTGILELLEQAGLKPEGIQRGGHRTGAGRVDRILLGWLRDGR